MPSGRLRKYGRGAAEQPAGDRADKGLATQKAGDAPPVPPSVIPDNSQFLQGDFASVKGGPKGGSQHAGRRQRRRQHAGLGTASGPQVHGQPGAGQESAAWPRQEDAGRQDDDPQGDGLMSEQPITNRITSRYAGEFDRAWTVRASARTRPGKPSFRRSSTRAPSRTKAWPSC
jgi:hypothetical protein